MKFRVLAFSLVLTSSASTAFAAPPYAGEEFRDIKALSSEEVSAYLSGKGMGFAKAAELNGFAGPAHVLELATQLQLTPEQRVRTEALFTSMSAKASLAGRALVEKERELDRLFAEKTVTPRRLSGMLNAIGALTAAVRNAHLQAHMAQVEILTPQQNALYGELRGYAADATRTHPGHKH